MYRMTYILQGPKNNGQVQYSQHILSKSLSIVMAESG